MLPTTIQPFTLLSDQDGLPLSGLLLLPQEETTPCGILQVSHGMCEHKERYLDFLRHCTKQGYICLIHDHRGHGEQRCTRRLLYRCRAPRERLRHMPRSKRKEEPR